MGPVLMSQLKRVGQGSSWSVDTDVRGGPGLHSQLKPLRLIADDTDVHKSGIILNSLENLHSNQFVSLITHWRL